MLRSKGLSEVCPFYWNPPLPLVGTLHGYGTSYPSQRRERVRMRTLTRPSEKSSNIQPPRTTRRRRFSPLMLIGTLLTVVIALGAGVFVVTRSHTRSQAAAAVNGDCTLIVPPQPLTAHGLATPWQLVATNPNNGP